MPSVVSSKFVFAVLAATVGSAFQHGYHTGIVNIPAAVFQDWIKEVKTRRMKGKLPRDEDVMLIWSTAVATFSVGGIVGGFLTGYFSDRCGRKNSLLWNNIIAAAGIGVSVCSKPADYYELLIFGRFIAGINAGLNCGLCQIYLIEIAPYKIRGAVGCFYQLVLCMSILLSEVSGLILGTERMWPYMFVLALIPAVFQIATLPFCPDSPEHLLMTKDNERRAAKALSWYRGTTEIQAEMNEMKQDENLLEEMNLKALKTVFTNSTLKNSLTVSVVLNIGQQFCGINGVIFFSTEALVEMGLDLTASAYVTIGLGTAMVLGTLMATVLVDKIGRRILLFSSFMGMCVTSIALSFLLVASKANSSNTQNYFAILISVLFLVIFSMGAGPIPWFITAELFSYAARSFAVSTTAAFNWFSNFLIYLTFLSTQEAMGGYIFLVFATLDCFFACYTFVYLPETNQLSAKAITEMYIQGRLPQIL